MQNHKRIEFPELGFGLGLRPKHYEHIFNNMPKVDWFEIISENFMDTDGKPKRNLARIKEHYPIVMHGVAMSIGTVDPLNSEYLQKLKKLIDYVNPAWVSDHLCWTGVAHKNTHDLLPVPYTEEALKHIISRIKQVQDYLGRKIAFENPSTYLEFKSSLMPEAEFIARMADEADCNLLLDVNNVYVTCYNHRLDAKKYLDLLPLDRVIQVHLSGHTNKGTHIVDTHDDHVVDEVWNLYKYLVQKAGRTPNTMVEWDDNIPDFPVLYSELEKAKQTALNSTSYKLPNSFSEKPIVTGRQTTSLPESQNLMQIAIIKGSAFNSKAEEWIVSKKEFSPEEQLAVYTNAYRYRLYDITAEDYPVLEHYLGKDKFKELIWNYVNATNSEHFNIAKYTLKLPEFVKNKFPKDIFAYELCELETTICHLADELETKALSIEELQSLTPERLMESVLQPRIALKLFSFNYPVNEYYQHVMDEKLPKKPKANSSYLVTFRDDDIVWRMDLEADEYKLLNKIFNGIKVGIALEEFDESIMEKLSEYFSKWMRNNLITKII